MADTLQGLSASTASAGSSLEFIRKRYRTLRRRRILVRSFLLAAWPAVFVGAYLLLSYVQPMIIIKRNLVPPVLIHGDQTSIPMPNGILVADVGTYTDELTAYLRYDYLKGIQSLAHSNVFLVPHEEKGGPEYTLYAQMPNNLLAAYRTLGDLVIGGYISSWELKSPPYSQITRWENETKLFNAAYQQPLRERLLQLPRAALTSAVASFILFKVRTDRRIRLHLEPANGKELTTDDARDFAADMITVAEFYKIPLPMLLGIGAMENNYLDITGDLKHAVWKHRAQHGDIILRRRRGRVLVSNYSVGPWQITRETLRYAHNLYRRDRKKRDYNELPPRLRPAPKLNFNQLSTGVLTTYAGLLLRHLLDYFHGDVQKAEGAYNGGRRDPNATYSEGVEMVANYARRVIGMAAGRKGNAVSETPLVLAPKKAPAPKKIFAPKKFLVPNKITVPSKILEPEKIPVPSKIVVPKKILTPNKILVPNKIQEPATVLTPEKGIAPKP